MKIKGLLIVFITHTPHMHFGVAKVVDLPLRKPVDATNVYKIAFLYVFELGLACFLSLHLPETNYYTI